MEPILQGGTTQPQFGDVCVVIPMYNESTVISDTVADARRYFARVLCVDDGSTDDGAARAREAGAVVLRHPFNLGQGAALRTGLRKAAKTPGVNWIVTFDADGQHSAADAARLVIAASTSGVDAVLGSRFIRDGHNVPWRRLIMLRAALWLTKATSGLDLSDTHNGLRVLSREAVDRLDLRQAGMAHASEILHELARLKLTVREEPVTVTYTDYSRAKGQSSLNAVNILHELLLARLRVAK